MSLSNKYLRRHPKEQKGTQPTDCPWMPNPYPGFTNFAVRDLVIAFPLDAAKEISTQVSAIAARAVSRAVSTRTMPGFASNRCVLGCLETRCFSWRVQSHCALYSPSKNYNISPGALPGEGYKPGEVALTRLGR
eukprot:1012717-Amphidinium_carterae.1